MLTVLMQNKTSYHLKGKTCKSESNPSPSVEKYNTIV